MKDLEAYEGLKVYYDNLRSMDRMVSVAMLAYEYLRLTRQVGYTDAIRKRIQRWCEREKIVQRRVTHVAQNTLYNVTYLIDFVSYINSQIVTSKYPLSAVVSLDETNLCFDPCNLSNTLADKGDRTIRIKTSGASSRCTVILAVAMDGTKLPPLIVFKGKPGARVAKEFGPLSDYPGRCEYTVQLSAWVDEVVFLTWIKKVWEVYSERMDRSYILMDEFRVHMMGSCIRALAKCRTEVDFVLGGYTSKLQVLDVGIMKPFKHYITQCYEGFMLDNTTNRRAKRLNVAGWINSAWDLITEESILNTWASIGYHNNNIN